MTDEQTDTIRDIANAGDARSLLKHTIQIDRNRLVVSIHHSGNVMKGIIYDDICLYVNRVGSLPNRKSECSCGRRSNQIEQIPRARSISFVNQSIITD